MNLKSTRKKLSQNSRKFSVFFHEILKISRETFFFQNFYFFKCFLEILRILMGKQQIFKNFGFISWKKLLEKLLDIFFIRVTNYLWISGEILIKS